MLVKKSNFGVNVTNLRRARLKPIATAPVLGAGGKPSTWFPPGGCRANHFIRMDFTTAVRNCEYFVACERSNFKQVMHLFIRKTLRRLSTCFFQKFCFFCFFNNVSLFSDTCQISMVTFNLHCLTILCHSSILWIIYVCKLSAVKPYK